MRILCFLLLLILPIISYSQQLHKVAPAAGESLPGWAIKMYGDHPNVWEVDDEYRAWRKTNADLKTTYTQYYKKWRRAAEPIINTQGFIQKQTPLEQEAYYQRLDKLKTSGDSRGSADWSVMGPVETFNTNSGPSPLPKSSQANIYCIDQTRNNPNIVYCGTEGG